MAGMETAAHLAAIRRESQALFDAASKDLGADVPTCDGWTMARLVGHVGRVYDWIAGWVMTGGNVEPRSAPRDETVLDFAAEARDRMVAAVADLGQHGTTTTWLGEQPVSFWPRRMAIETAIHRWDAENALGRAEAVPVDLAVDGVDELLQVLAPARLADELRAMAAVGATVHLHATDCEEDGVGEWLVTFTEDGGLDVRHEHAKGDVAVRATASDQLLLLWNRIDPDQLEIFGDRGLLDRWRDHMRI
jgi:uncharacterized protein (TIGR03083 family)